MFSGDIYLSLDTSLLSSVFSALAAFKLSCDDGFVILLAILLPIKSSVASAVSSTALFEVFFSFYKTIYCM